MVRKYQLYVCLILILKLFSIRSKVGQKMGSGFNKTISSYGIIGFVRFLEGYYMILITSRLKAAMLGHHSVFKIADTAMVYIPNEEVRETHPGKHIFALFWSFFLATSTFQTKKFVKLIQVNLFFGVFPI